MALLTWLLRGPLRAAHAVSVSWRQRLWPMLPHALTLSLAVIFYPTDALSWSGNRVTNELVQNGFSSFFRAALTNEIDYGAYYATRSPADNLAALRVHLAQGGGRFVHPREQPLDRAFAARPDGLGNYNVVLVASESFGAEFSKLYGSEHDLTPEFDRFAQQGLWFSRTYASGTRTVRGLEALTAVMPPIPTVSIVRRPGNEDIATWGKVMRGLGYETSFLYGGYSYFDNMQHFYASNGFEVADRSDIDQPRFANIWGVSDEDLFDLAIERFDAQHRAGKPFFSIIMTTSNHKPYTFRSGLEGIGVPPSGGGRAAGVRYADHALGYFLREAAKAPWFDHTLFVVIADHGARVYGKQEIPLKTYEIPLMIYAPKVIKPRRVDTLMTQIDVAPTVLGMLGLAYEAPFFGQDVLHYPEASRVALFNHNHDVAILQGQSLVVFGLHRKIDNFQYDRGSDSYRRAPRNLQLENLGIAYFQTASEMYRNHTYQ
jgi:membrane-anchored protein YejM (alkaline phosphatase superfamily)